MNERDIEIHELIDDYKRLDVIVNERLHEILSGKMSLMHITHRIKTIESINGKLERKPDVYSKPQDIYDILGFRVICYFLDDVNSAAAIIENNFRVDRSKSKDKRQLIDAKSFGYVAIHYVCALPESYGELSTLWFEIQIKTILQHSWAEIEHDLGYKTEVEVPRNIRRSFSKAASLLEVADDIFSDIRTRLEEYRISVKNNIEAQNLDAVFFDKITLAEFTSHNKTYRNLLKEIADITNARITEHNPESQLPLIEFLGIHSLGDMVRLIEEEHDLTLKLAEKMLRDSEIDEISSNAAYHFLFRAELISGNYSKERIREFFMLTTKNEKSIESNTEKIIAAQGDLFGKTAP